MKGSTKVEALEGEAAEQVAGKIGVRVMRPMMRRSASVTMPSPSMFSGGYCPVAKFLRSPVIDTIGYVFFERMGQMPF